MSWVVETSFPNVTKLNEINVQKKAKTILTFHFPTIYATVPHDLLKFYLKLQILSLNKKLAVTIVFQKQQFTGHQKVVEKDNSKEKL